MGEYMKKRGVLFFAVFALSFCLTAQKMTGSAEKRFVKGNIQDKIEVVKDSDTGQDSRISVMALDFVLENLVLLQDDRDMAHLAVACILAYPASEFTDAPGEAVDKFAAVFYKLNDETVKITILEKILSLSQVQQTDGAVSFVNTYLYEAMKDKAAYSGVEQKAVNVLFRIGNTDSFLILYKTLKNGVWAEASETLQDALRALAEQSADTLTEIIENAGFEEMELIYSVFLKNSGISERLKSEIAEKMLTKSMIMVRDSSTISKEISDFQLNTCRILYENNWTRSSELVCSYFELAKTQYKANFLSDAEFCRIIKYVERISSKDSVAVFTEYLGELNAEMDNGNLPAVTVVSALIQSLGALGDKSAFDCLLYATYLNYPEEIIAQARSALSGLKW